MRGNKLKGLKVDGQGKQWAIELAQHISEKYGVTLTVSEVCGIALYIELNGHKLHVATNYWDAWNCLGGIEGLLEYQQNYDK